MGIKNLNKLIKKNPIKKQTANNLIIDGYNIVITLIQSLLAQTKDTAVEFNIIEIYKFLVDTISYRIKTIIDRAVKNYKCNCIYFVIDGLCQKSLLMETGDIIDIKALEHVKREAQLNRQRVRLMNSIENACIDNEEIEYEKERRFFEIGDNYRYLIYPIIDKIYDLYTKPIKDINKGNQKGSVNDIDDVSNETLKDEISNDDNQKATSNDDNQKDIDFILLESIYEADYTIANLANSLDSAIIMSLDTDFFVMCCDSINVFIMNFKEQYQLYSPYNEWKNILEDCSIEFNKNLIYRLAPLFGNDYTANETDKQYIISAEDDDSIKMIILRDIEVPKRKKKLFQLKSLINYSSEIISLDELDDAIEKFSIKNEKYNTYYEKYKKSVYAYEHMDTYFEFIEYTPKRDGLEKIEKLFPNPKTFVTDEFSDLIECLNTK